MGDHDIGEQAVNCSQLSNVNNYRSSLSFIRHWLFIIECDIYDVKNFYVSFTVVASEPRIVSGTQ